MSDPGSVPMTNPLAYFLTWTTYGTWLPGDDRGWVKEHEGFQLPDRKVEHEARRKLTESTCVLDSGERQHVEETIRKHCEIRRWKLWAVACRTNHVHAVVSAPVSPDTAMDQFKAWCTRRLKEINRSQDANWIRENWWTEDGSHRFINDEASLEATIVHVLECQ